MPVDFRDAISRNGHPTDELKSWLQKAIRRGLGSDAVYCAVELDLLGFPGAVWNTLRHCVSEDIGLADPGIAADFQALYEIWKEECRLDKQKGCGTANRLHIVHAVLMCCAAQKSRLVDDTLIVIYEGGQKMDVPDWALDKHTARGARMGRGVDHFFTEGNILGNEDTSIKNPWTKYAQEIRKARETRNK